MRTIPIVIAALLVLGGCARSVAERGTGWWRVTSEHVELSTDVERSRAITAGWAFEDVYRALAHVFPACDAPPISEPARVIMFAREDEYDSIAPPYTSGYFRAAESGIVGAPATLVVRAGSGSYSGNATQVYTHELTHRFVARCFPNAPSWLHEGMARYFETIRVGADEVVVGIAPYRVEGLGPPSELFRSGGLEILQLGRDYLRSPAEVIALDAAGFYASDVATRNYAGAWALVHLLMLGPSRDLRSRFTRYLASLPASTDEAASLAASFGDVSLDAAIAGYFERPLLERRERYDPPALGDPPAVALPPEQAHLVLATLLRRRGDADLRARALTHVALAAEAPGARARAALLRLELGVIDEWETKASVLARLTSEHPDDLDVLSARVDVESTRAAPTNEGRLLLDALAARPDLRATDLARLCDLASVHRRHALAIELGTRAVSLSPSDVRAHAALARALRVVSRFAEAERELRLAWITAGHGAPPALAGVDRAAAPEPVSHAAPVAPPPPVALPLEPGAGGALLALAGEVVAARPALDLALECVGFVGPVATIDVPEGAPPLVIRTRGSDDMVLAVEDAAGAIRCDDDSGGETNAAVFGAWPAGRLVIHAGGFRPSDAPIHWDLVIERADGALEAGSVPTQCGLETPSYGALRVGLRVRLGRHRPWIAEGDRSIDPIVEEGWAAPMDALVGREARVIALAPVDAAGCSVVRVDADEGRWLWRARDLAPP